MNNGFLLFFGILLAMVTSWFGFVHSPQVQFGKLVPELDEASGKVLPVPRSGAANRGRDIYRQNGCASCHTQQVRQKGYDFSVVISDFGTNTVQAAEALAGVSSKFAAGSALPEAPHTVDSELTLRQAEKIVRDMGDSGVAIQAVIHPRGSDIERGWGSRRTVGRDYLLDTPVLPGSVRVGPDLSNIGNRNPDSNWHLVHLYQPRLAVENSVMPGYPFLFEKRPLNGQPDSDALRFNGELVVDDQNRQIIPRASALDLVAYLRSLRLDDSLFEAPGLISDTAAEDSAEAATDESGQTE